MLKVPTEQELKNYIETEIKPLKASSDTLLNFWNGLV